MSRKIFLTIMLIIVVCLALFPISGSLRQSPSSLVDNEALMIAGEPMLASFDLQVACLCHSRPNSFISIRDEETLSFLGRLW